MSLFTIIITSTLCILLFIGISVYLVQITTKRINLEEEKRRDLAQAHHQDMILNTLKVEENQKLKIASDLHDHFGVNLSSIKILLNHLKETATAPIDSDISFERIDSLLSTTINDIRSLSHEIAPPLLNELGLILALEEIKTNLESKISISISSNRNEVLADPWNRLQAFRICQEFIQNTLKHAESKTLDIKIKETIQYFFLKLEDHGIGFEYSTTKSFHGNGIKNILVRGENMGGSTKIKSKKNKGTTFLLLIQKNENNFLRDHT